jgi:hypothetical protein
MTEENVIQDTRHPGPPFISWISALIYVPALIYNHRPRFVLHTIRLADDEDIVNELWRWWSSNEGSKGMLLLADSHKPSLVSQLPSTDEG